MKIKFSITNLKIDLSNAIDETKTRKWYWRNAKIPEDTEIKDLTPDQIKSLIKLAIYEGHLEMEDFCNVKPDNIILIP